MKKIRSLLLFLLLTLVSFQLKAQDGITVALGAATYAMEDMKYYQEYKLEAYPLGGMITSSFPTYTSMSLGFSRQLMPRLRAEILYANSVTGGRSSYYDYSGYIYTDFNMSSNRLGVRAAYQLLQPGNFEISLLASLQGNYTTNRIDTEIYVMGNILRSSEKFRALQAALEGGIQALYNFDRISLGAEATYLKDLPRALVNKDTKAELTDPNDPSRTLGADWTGLNLKVSLILWLNDEP